MRLNSLVRFDEQYTRTDAERVSERMLRPFHQFARWQASGALLLLVCAVAALVWANSPWATAYGQMLHAPLSLSLSERVLQLDLRHWINDGLMAIFFFAVGLEIKRELIVGELADRRKAMLPIAAAIGGMVVPALCYAAANIGGEGARGWGIPMATDIAFALGALAVLGSRIPEGLKVFLVALAIVDDLGALLVIAVVYTAAINWNGLALAAVFLGALFVANRSGARQAAIYLALGIGAWYGLLVSGVHATLAGVLAALFVPARARIVPGAVATVIRRSADAIDVHAANGVRGAMEPERFTTISVLSRTLDAANSPIQRFEHMVHPWVAFGIVPVFALFNAGVAIDASAIRTLAFPVPLGIVAGLVVGKPLGIFVASWLAVKTGLATLPEGVSWRHVSGTAWLAGIGFTMALFISGLAFTGIGLESQAKLAILVGSVVSAVVGLAILLTARRLDAVAPSRSAHQSAGLRGADEASRDE
jgi:NhaA family Na+:H+ antiporter